MLAVFSLVLVSIAFMRVQFDGARPVFMQVSAKRELPVYRVQRDDNKVSISFDAAWGTEYTTELLDILDKYNVKTTFFLVGYWVEKYPDEVREIVARGHEIGSHSDTHPHMSKLSVAQMKKELQDINIRVEAITGIAPTLFRPPYGDYNNTVVRTTRELGMECVQWSVDSLDWKDLTAQQILERCTKNTKSGDIILFHNNAKHVVEALPLVLEKLQGQGFEIVKISEILLSGETQIDHAGEQQPKTT